MFERLINAPPLHKVPSNTLAIQRRMRKNICDLTREFYQDIVEIEDHKQCSAKKIGDKLINLPSNWRLRKRTNDPSFQLRKCIGSGREVPGVLPHIFFWTHKGIQTMSQVGLSRVNNNEADMALKLTMYLVSCGVPKPSIAILTPYKGQLMLMRNGMMKNRLLSKDPNNSVRMSTVDRFQGDEADVVIISLVIDAKSHTPFVKLCNRMVVLLSRARLGMYILGNIGYFEEKPDSSIEHWLKTIDKLRHPSEPDTDQSSVKEDVDSLHFHGPRLGDELPICCPIHREKTINAKTSADLELNFCSIKCTVKLSCSHPCDLNCHFQSMDDHSTTCMKKISPPPCHRHNIDLTCSDIYSNVTSKNFPPSYLPIENALKLYRCPTETDVELPCQHIVKMTCADETDIADGKKNYPECKELAHNPYVYPGCCHELPVLCCTWFEYKKDPSRVKPCKEKVLYASTCGHSVNVQCSLKQKYENGEAPFQCKEKVERLLPRCAHKANVSCDKDQQLTSWKGVSCVPGVVKEGQRYGPTDHICDEMVSFERKCGHTTSMKCGEAFQQAQFPSKCTEDVTVINPECGHKVITKCFEKHNLQAKGLLLSRQPVECVYEGRSSLTFGTSTFHVKCQEKVEFVRKCNHRQTIKCCEARVEHIQPCSESVVARNPLCMHDVNISCYLSKFAGWKPWANYYTPLLDGVLADSLPSPVAPPDSLKKYVLNCKENIEVLKGKCGHKYKSKCGEAMRELGTQLKTKCTVKIENAQLNCGHLRKYLCWEYAAYLKHPENTVCYEKVYLTCWNNQSCKSILKSSCNFTGQIMKCEKKTEFICSANHTTKELPLCQRGMPSYCPECILTDIRAYGKNLEYQKSNKQDILLPGVPLELSQFNPEKIYDKESIKSFLDSQIAVLSNLEVWSKKQAPLERPLFAHSIIPCFRYEFEKRFSLDFKGYMKASTLSGIQVFEWTVNNIERLINETVSKRKKVCLLFGFVFCCRVLVDPNDYPGKNKKPHQKAAWVKENRLNQAYCILQHNKNGWDNLIVWDPYPVIATHKIWMTVSNLQQISTALKRASSLVTRAQLQPRFITFQIPQNAESLVTRNDTEEDEQFDKVSLEDHHLNGAKSVLWDGLSLGRKEIFDDQIQNELMNKLQFCITASGSSAAERPFDGKNYVDNLVKTFKEEVPELSLLKALEQQKLEDFEAAEVDLNNYLEKTNGVQRHPLHIIAKARQILYNEEASPEGKELLNTFANLYPNAVDNWFELQEKKLLEEDDQDENEARTTDPNSPLVKWEALKDAEGVESEQMDELMKLTGLRKVKNSAFEIFKAALKFSQLSPEVQVANPKSLNFCFLGNAGSGKTTVARMLAEILKDSGARSKGTFVETSAQKLKDEGPEKFRSLADTAEDGVLFIDEAYDLDPKGDFKGKPIVSELLVIAENKRDKLSIILAGYEDDMNEKLFSFNEGIKSRFEMLYFEDFNEKELKAIWEGEVKRRHFTCDERASTVVSKRLFKSAGRKGFGNARAVRKEVEKAISVCMGREDFNPKNMFINIKDVMGESPLDNPKLKDVLREINEKIGWKAIKKSVNELLEICKKNYELQLSGHKTLPFMPNRLFLGNPGTGKTTCAGLYGRLLKELNILSNGDVIMASSSDFVGSAVGESQKKTNAMLEKARGKVLVIDEAYNLDDKLYGKQVLDTIVEKVQNTENDDIAVLMLGYEKQMREMLRNQNPGLARRFSSDYPFMFEDYTQQELLLILRFKCKKENIVLSAEVSEAIINLLEKQKSQANFGNAGAINNLIGAAVAKASVRPLMKGGKVKLELSDIESGEASAKTEDADPFAPLDRLYRMEKVREELTKIKNTFQVAKAEGAREMPELGHFVFRGAPGTGKTTVARVMANILFKLGLLPRKHVEETSGLDLTGEYVGQTKKKVQEKLDAAKGGVLFIDEAYELGKGIYGEEALTTVLAAMTDPDYKLVIIIAGYPEDMENMLARNVGLKSRFTRYIDFLNWGKEDCVRFIEKKAQADNFILEKSAKKIISDGSAQLQQYPGWGNARDIIAMWKIILEQRASRVVGAPEKQKTITESDTEQAVNKIVTDRKPKGDQNTIKRKLEEEHMQRIKEQLKQMTLDEAQQPPKIDETVKMEEKQEQETAEEQPSYEDEEQDPNMPGRDPGVPDAVWEELQKAKQKEDEDEKRRKKEREMEEQKQKEREVLQAKLNEKFEVQKLEKKALQESERKAEEKKRLVEKLRKELEEERDRERQRELQRQLEEQRRKDEQLRRKLQEERERQRKEEERLLKIKLQLELERKKAEEAARKRAEDERKRQAIQEKLKQISPCPAGFDWRKVGDGWRCSAGGHFVSDRQLNDQFTH